MEIRILEKVEGAKRAEGLSVIIDVFRAFSLECYLTDMGVGRILPVGDIEEARALARASENCISIGERSSVPLEGFDFGNSPYLIRDADLRGKTAVHTTSSGTQGIVNAVHAERIISGALVNAAAVVRYIKRENPAVVSLCAMGNNSTKTSAAEDVLCAEYIRALLLGEKFDIAARAGSLRDTRDGARFFLPENQSFTPRGDFFMCIDYDRFDFVLEARADERGLTYMQRVDI